MKSANLLLAYLISSSSIAVRTVGAWIAAPLLFSIKRKSHTSTAITTENINHAGLVPPWKNPLHVHRGKNGKSCPTRSRFTMGSSRRMSDNNDYDGVDLEEEYYQQHESSYHSPENIDDGLSVTEKIKRSKEKQLEQQGALPQPSTMPSNKGKKVEVAKPWDESMLDGRFGSESVSESIGKESGSISNLSDLQQKLLQIQNRNKEPSKDYDFGPDGVSDGFAPRLDKNNQNSRSDELAKKIAAEASISDRYLDIVRKAEERLSKMEQSSSGSDVNANSSKARMVSNMAGLEERLRQIQQDTDVDTNAGTNLPPPELEPNAKRLDDETLAEWEELEYQLQLEAAEKKSTPRPLEPNEEGNEEVSVLDEAAILDALRSEAAGSTTSNKKASAKKGSDDSSDTKLGDNLGLNDTPKSYKKEKPGYEITDDGGVYLSAEAYQKACETSNSDGSINFDSDRKYGNSDVQKPLKSSFVDEGPPMAPYAQDIKGSINSKRFTIEDLAREASRSIEYARDNPDVQEELHRRIMAEFEAEEATTNKFEKEVLLDPEKARAFWNQEYFEQQQQESDALDELLDEKLRQLEEEEREEKEAQNSRSDGQRKRYERISVSEAYKQQSMSERNIFFASREERIDRRRFIERTRRERAKKIAKFYQDESNSSWSITSESKEVQKMTERQDVLQNRDLDNLERANNSTDLSESKQDVGTTKNQENLQDDYGKNDQSTNLETTKNSDWVLVEDPESPEDAFYWNEVTGEMSWDSPEDS